MLLHLKCLKRLPIHKEEIILPCYSPDNDLAIRFSDFFTNYAASCLSDTFVMIADVKCEMQHPIYLKLSHTGWISWYQNDVYHKVCAPGMSFNVIDLKFTDCLAGFFNIVRRGTSILERKHFKWEISRNGILLRCITFEHILSCRSAEWYL